MTVSHLSSRGLLDVHPQPVDLPAGRSEVTLQLQLPLSQSFNFSLSGHVLSEEFQLVHLQFRDFILQLTELAGHHVTLQGDHCHIAGHNLLAGGVQGHVVLLGHVRLAKGGQAGSLLG